MVAAATVGDGVFALPFIFYASGWIPGVFFLVVLAVFISMAHFVYLKTLEKNGEKEHLLGFARRYLGVPGFWAGLMAIVVGLLLTLVAYLVLGSQFLSLAIPGIPAGAAFLIFWAIISVPVFVNDRHLFELELLGVGCTAAIIIFIFLTAWPSARLASVPAVNPENFLLPFGAILFSLAGWTSVEPVFEFRKKLGANADPWRPLAVGTFLAALLYLLFVIGIIASVPALSTDTVAGLAGWPLWKKDIIAACGLIAVATVYMPISREIKKSMEIDLHWGKWASRTLIILFPPALVLAGVNNFMLIVSVVGGLFLSMQYLLIAAIGRRALTLAPWQKLFLDLITLSFIGSAVYQAYIFVVH